MSVPPVPPSRRERAARRRSHRRRQLVAGLVVVTVAAVVAAVALGGSSGPRRAARATTTTTAPAAATAAGIPAAEAGVLPWSLDAPLSRAVVVPGGGTSLLVAGGLDAAQTSVTGVVSVDTTTGDETDLGALAQPDHDAAGAVVAGKVTVMGGGSPNTVATVQSFPAPPGAGTPAPAPSASATTRGGRSATTTTTVSVPGTPPVVITGQTTTTRSPTPVAATVSGQLPQPRSDAAAVTVGRTVYVVGGYDGTNPDGAVLATADGVHYRTVAQLAVPVRYGATVVLDGKILVFGGQAVGGPSAGAAVDDVQQVDPGTGKVRTVGHLTTPVAGASAFVLGGTVYLAGGVPSGTGGSLATTATGAVWAWDGAHDRALAAGTLPVPVAFAGTAVTAGRAWLVGGETTGAPVASVEMVVQNPKFGPAGQPGAGSPYYGYKLLVADRGNNRLLVLQPGDQITWTFPSATEPPPPGGFYFPDDAFFAAKGTEIISNQEENETIVILGYPSGTTLWQYGHPMVSGSGPGYLSEPDDAYLLRNGQITVADDKNCRILFIDPDKSVAGQIGTTGSCVHEPPTRVGSPNGDTPLPDGNVLVSEIDGQWISEYTPQGKLVWTTHLDVHYPSDPQPLGPDLYMVADYDPTAGAIDEFNQAGQILYRLQPATGLDRMNQPSLAELLPTGVFMVNDDYRDRMAAYDPATGALVWEYGHPDHPGTAPGLLDIPDGFDLLAPDGSTPTHPTTG